MNTFLPYESFEQSIKCLDNKRLGKQRVEVYQILKALLQGPYTCTHCGGAKIVQIIWENPRFVCLCYGSLKKTPWYNHPAVQMWKGHERALAFYGLQCCAAWTARGFKDTVMEKIERLWQDLPKNTSSFPKWFRNKKFHASHRSNLLRKDSKYYRQFGWKEPNNLPYYWPTKNGY